MLNCCEYKKIDVLDVVLMYRISTEFSIEEWQNIFLYLYNRKVQNIVFVPTEIASMSDLILELYGKVKRKLMNQTSTFCGYLYGKKEIDTFFNKFYIVKDYKKVKHTGIYFLEIK